MESTQTLQNKNTFIDLFSGCGGFSLGLIEAGWKGLFAIEKDAMAFKTLNHNLIEGNHKAFDWPEWLEQEAMPISRLLNKYKAELSKLNGKVDLIVGGPPCQGFSVAGRRNKNDPRNKLTNEYLRVVKKISPNFIVIENVRGFDTAFQEDRENNKNKSYAEYVKNRLVKLGYTVFSDYIKSSKFGVPQRRTRFIIIAVKKQIADSIKLNEKTPFDHLMDMRNSFLINKNLNPAKVTTVSEAISDLKISNKKLVISKDSPTNNHLEIQYLLPKKLSPYKKLMRRHMVNGTAPSDLRLPRHKPSTIEKFKDILALCEKGKTISSENKKELDIKKQAITPLSPSKVSATVTTLPDDILHYSEPRILTVRENARLQSFPDWFQFQGKYTTGGNDRKKECPRYSQVGNAVPPLLSEALGQLLMTISYDEYK